jgi:hypothetical protein
MQRDSHSVNNNAIRERGKVGFRGKARFLQNNDLKIQIPEYLVGFFVEIVTVSMKKYF